MKIRCFIALDLPFEIKDYIREIQESMKKENLFFGRFTPIENLHLTLKFLGEIEEEKVSEVRKKLKEINFKEFEAELGEVGVFSENFIRIIWVKIKNCNELQKIIDEKLDGLFEKENRFMGHVTIARVKRVEDKQKLLDYVKGVKESNLKFKVKEFSLKKSELLKEGAKYSDIEKYKLKS